jgi:uncharacterized protein DUF6074
MAKVVPFPLVRRKTFIARQASLIAAMRPEAGQRQLERQLAFQARVLLAKNIDMAVVDREVTRLRSALQTAIACGRCDHGDFA